VFIAGGGHGRAMAIGPSRTHRARTRHAQKRRGVPVNPGTARHVKAVVTCDPAQSRSGADEAGMRRGALLMRFGGNTIRGSNPRSSALGVGIYRTRMRFACGGRSGLVRAGCTHEALTGSARAPMALAGIWLASWNYGGSRFGCAPRDFRERCDVGLVGERGPAMAEQRADVLGAQDGGLTARKRVRDADIW